MLDLEAIEVNIFRGKNLDETRLRVFGGQVAAQSLVAAGRTVDQGRVHSLHSYFLRPGDPTAPILYEVDRIRDGRSFTTRRVVAIQHGRAIFNLQCSFHIDEGPGLVHQFEMPEVPRPEELATFRERLEPYRDAVAGVVPASTGRGRSTSAMSGTSPGCPTASAETRQRLWVRADGELPDDPLLHAAVVAYASDMSIIDSILKPHEITWETGRRWSSASTTACGSIGRSGLTVGSFRPGLAQRLRGARPRQGPHVRRGGPPCRESRPGGTRARRAAEQSLRSPDGVHAG